VPSSLDTKIKICEKIRIRLKHYTQMQLMARTDARNLELCHRPNVAAACLKSKL